MKWRREVIRWGLLTGLCGLLWPGGAIAQETLTRAEVYRLRNQVELLLRNQPARPARLSDVLVPLDALRTASSAVAELLFNEGSIARVDQNTTFRFETGLRRFQLPNLVALNETIFVLEDGAALVISPPQSVGTQIRTPEVQVNLAASALEQATARLSYPPGEAIAAYLPQSNPWKAMQMSPSGGVKSTIELSQQTSPASPSSEPLLPAPERSSAVMVVHDASNGTTRVFALTDGDIAVMGLAGQDEVSLLGGQTVAIANGEFSPVQEFDLVAFYQSVPLAAGLGPGQESNVAQQLAPVQATLNAVRDATLASVRRQSRRLSGFGATFLRDALSGADSDFNPQRNQSTVLIDTAQSIDGTFVRGRDIADGFTGVFVDAAGNTIPITVNTETRSITIGGQAGIANTAGLSGDRAVGTVIFADGTTVPLGALNTVTFRDGQAVRVEVFNVNGDFDTLDPGDRRPGRLTVGRPPDR